MWLGSHPSADFACVQPLTSKLLFFLTSILFYFTLRLVPALVLLCSNSKQIVDYVLSHWDNPEIEFATLIRMDNDKETPLSYQERMLGGRKDWGGFPELVAAARVFGTHIVVFHYTIGVRLCTEP